MVIGNGEQVETDGTKSVDIWWADAGWQKGFIEMQVLWR